MKKVYRLSVKIPYIIIGIPLLDSENPLLSVPFHKLKIKTILYKCNKPNITIKNNINTSTLITAFYNELIEISPETCLEISIEEAPIRDNTAGLYSAITTGITYALARYNGEKLEPWEIVELSRYADPLKPLKGWHNVMDALRYSAATGLPSVYRNDEEFATIENPVTKIEAPLLAGQVEAKQAVTRDTVGGEIYNALVKLSGILVLEGSVKIREEGLTSLISSLGRIQNGIISMMWSLEKPKEGCIYSPGFPGFFEILCW